MLKTVKKQELAAPFPLPDGRTKINTEKELSVFPFSPFNQEI
jgi:hypothetical protein